MSVVNARRTRFDARLTRTVVSSGAKQFVFKISTDREARDGMVIPSEAWDFSEYMRNPVVLLAHGSRDLPIGRATDVQRDPDGLTATVEFDEQDEIARQVRSKVERGFVSATSVGFQVLDMRGNRVTQAELLEISIVAVPSDPGALAVSRDFHAPRQPIEPTPHPLAAFQRATVNEAARPLLNQLDVLNAKRRIRRLGPAEVRQREMLLAKLRGIYR